MMEPKQGEVIAARAGVDTLWVGGQGRSVGSSDI